MESIVSRLEATEEDKDAILSRASSFYHKRRVPLVSLEAGEADGSRGAEDAGQFVPLPLAGEGETSMVSEVARAAYKRKRGDSVLLSDLIEDVE